ncbi:MAG: hypothetical protein ACXVAD_06530 [Syntrophales bacterium]
MRSRFTEVWVEELTNLDELAGLVDTWSNAREEAPASHKKSKRKKGRDARDKKISGDKKPAKTDAKKEDEGFASDKRFTHYSM